MKRALFLTLLLACAAVTVAAQNLAADLKSFTETPAVLGYERALAEKIRAQIPTALGNPHTDNLGNLYLTIGSGAPHRLLVAPMDEPGYVVSAITADGYLRVQRLPQAAPHPLFDHLHEAQPVQILTRSGKWVTGIVAALSVHLQGARQDAPVVNHPDNIFIDIGASSAAEARRAGVDLLDAIVIERQLRWLGFGKLTAPAIGDRFGATALTELLRRLDPAKLRGTLTVAFVAQQWAGSRGLDRLLQQITADEMIYIGRLRPARTTAGLGARGRARAPGAASDSNPTAPNPAQDAPLPEPGAGVLLGISADAPSPLAEELERLAALHNLPLRRAPTAPLPRVSYTRGPEPPQRFAYLSVPTAWPATPAELLDSRDLSGLANLLELYATGAFTDHPFGSSEASSRASATPSAPGAPSMRTLLQRLVETYGMSTAEGPVREQIKSLLPSWAKPDTDAAGNLILRVAAKKPGSQAPSILVVAHMDEIGFAVESIAADGRLIVRSRGGGSLNFFAGHAMLVHTQSGDHSGVFELPPNWDDPAFEWPRGGGAAQGQPAPPLRIDVGARNAAQVAELGIKVGDSVTIPKKYRPLFGTRANGRSFDDRVGCAALIAAAWALGPSLVDRDVTFAWVTEEELGLRGALAMAAAGHHPDYVFAVDTFVSADSPLESKRYANAPIGSGFVIRAVDNSNIAPRDAVEKLIRLARANAIPVQYGVTGGGNDGAAFLRHGAVDIPISWPLRYSHSPGEVIDLRDAEALARIVAAISRSW